MRVGTNFFVLINAFFKSYLMKAFSYILLSNIIGAVTGFALIALYTRMLPPSDFGRITLLWLFTIIVSTIIDGRLNSTFSIRFYKSSREENTKNTYTILIFNITFCIIVYLILLSSPLLLQKILGIQVAISELTSIFLLVLFMVFANFYTNILIIDQRPKSYFWVKTIFNAVLVISSIIYLLVLREGYISYLKSYLISYLVIALLGLRFLIINYRPTIINIFSFKKLIELLKIGIPMVPNSLLLMFLTWSDRYMLNLYSGLEAVGIYTVGYRFSEIINSFVFGPFGQAISPMLFKKFAKSIEEYKKSLADIMKYYWLITIGITIGYFVILKEAFIFFVGSHYLEGYNITGIVILGIILWGISNTIAATILMKEKTEKVFLFTAVSVVTNIVLNLLLIPDYGMYGAAAATLISYFVQLTIIFYYTQKLIHIDYDYKFIGKSVLFSLCFMALILFLSYLTINIAVQLLLKIILFIIFIHLSNRWFHIIDFIKEISGMDKQKEQQLIPGGKVDE